MSSSLLDPEEYHSYFKGQLCRDKAYASSAPLLWNELLQPTTDSPS